MMAARGRGYSQGWDPMRDDYDNSTYDPQYPDDNSSNLVNLDHCRLYITNIPKGLNYEGIHTVFSKYGTLTEAFVSSNPEKQYGLVSFETPGEAKLAMMKLNRTEPLQLSISIAHKAKNQQKDTRNRVSGGQRDRDSRSYREETGSVKSRSNNNLRKQEDLANGDNMEDLIDDDAMVVGLNNSLDPDTSLELENLRLEHLKLQEAQVLCKHRMLLLKQAEKKSSSTSRCILPNGRIVVRNVDKSEVGRGGDASLGTGAGDSLKIPALQRVANCVACAGAASLFCGGCGVTPYCSPGCQRRDFNERHHKVCHNLKRSVGGTGVSSRLDLQITPSDDIPLLPAPLPLRRPRSPESVKRERHSDDSGSDRAPRANHKFGPPGTAVANRSSGAGPTRPGQGNARFGGNQGDGRQNQNGARNARANDRSDNRNQNRNEGERLARPGNRRDNHSSQDHKDEDWGAKPTPIPDPKPVAKPEAKPEDVPKPKSPAVQLVEPKLQPRLQKEEVKVAKTAPDVVSSSRQLVPKNCLVDLLSVNDTFTLGVESLAADCRAGEGFVCLSLNEECTEQYMQLLHEDFTESCLASPTIKPQPGESFAHLEPADGAWYRARRLAPGAAALLDASRLAAPAAGAGCRALPARYAALPEYSCLLRAPGAQVGDNFMCTVVSKSSGVLNVTLFNIETNAPQGSGTVQRWLPAVDYPAEPAPAAAPPTPATPATPAPAAPSIPEVPRPPLTDKSRVILVDATEPGRLFVRSSDVEQQKEFDDVAMEVAVYGMTAKPLTDPPVVGQTVVAKYTDDMCYRALCRRVNSKLNKYLLEYIEYGNTTVAYLEGIYACPPELTLSARPTLVSQATLQMSQKSFNEAATQYLDGLKNEATELILSVASGAATAASGSAVRLSVARSGADVNRAVAALCTPDWLKLLESGGDVMDIRAPMYDELSYVDLPSDGFELEVLDVSMLPGGSIAGHARGAPHAAKAFALADQLTEYCNSALCKDPYLPKPEELCVAYCPKRKQWVRAAFLQQESGAGGAAAELLLFDFGEVALLPVARLRKLPPELARAPAACCSLEIKDFPKEPTEAQLALAKQHMKVNDRGVGTLRIARAVKQAPGDFLVEAPELIRAMNA